MGNAVVRVPVSMRLPAEITSEIDAFAEKANMRKTDAYLHFIRLGLESEGKRDERDRLSAMEARIDEILALVKGERASEGAVDTVARVREAVATIAVDYPAIREAYLFGSMARGTITDESDIDLRLVIDREKGFNLHDLEHFCKEVERATGRSVDAVTAKTVKNKSLAAAIERDKVLIYER